MKMERKILLISFDTEDNDNCLMKAIDDNFQIDVVCAFKKIHIIFRIFRRLSFFLNIGVGFWLENWKYSLHKYDLCICIASKYSENILKWIHKKNSRLRLINYFWDKVEVLKYPIKSGLLYENWSFDEENALEYGMRFNPQFYADNLKLPSETIKYDISFVAADREGEWRERTVLVKKIYNQLENKNLRLFFYYVCTDKTNRTSYMYDKRISEMDFLKSISSSIAVLDIVDPEHSWNTLRPLLALTNGKKLITNNKNVKKEKYYLEDDIFIIGEDDVSKIAEFIHKPFVPLNKEIKEYYEVKSWINRFIN